MKFSSFCNDPLYWYLKKDLKDYFGDEKKIKDLWEMYDGDLSYISHLVTLIRSGAITAEECLNKAIVRLI